MPRQARLDACGTLHHVIVRGIEKRNIVTDCTDREKFVSRMGQIATDTATAVYAWALMKNHAHILLRSGPQGLSTFMRRFLTGYAVVYNRRHNRYGHLFQNRYKSIVCDEDSYFRELVRYIHLNPVRAGVVNDVFALEMYRWCGHGVLMGTMKYEWQDRDYTLSWFGNHEGKAKENYRQYVEEGVTEGRRPDLVGGGLIRSLGGWSQVLSVRRQGKRVAADERILGSGEFVESVLGEAGEKLRYQLGIRRAEQNADRLIEQACEKEHVDVAELKWGSRRRSVSRVRSQIAIHLVQDCGMSLAEAARQLGVSTSAISKLLSRRREGKSTQSTTSP